VRVSNRTIAIVEAAIERLNEKLFELPCGASNFERAIFLLFPTLRSLIAYSALTKIYLRIYSAFSNRILNAFGERKEYLQSRSFFVLQRSHVIC
jgi:hypothetical protein